jgi:LETM1 and EF-hand domain-containing protein 1
MKQSLKVKLEMAKFLQQTLDDMAVQGKGRSSEAAKEFSEFFIKVRCHPRFPVINTNMVTIQTYKVEMYSVCIIISVHSSF